MELMFFLALFILEAAVIMIQVVDIVLHKDMEEEHQQVAQVEELQRGFSAEQTAQVQLNAEIDAGSRRKQELGGGSPPERRRCGGRGDVRQQLGRGAITMRQQQYAGHLVGAANRKKLAVW